MVFKNIIAHALVLHVNKKAIKQHAKSACALNTIYLLKPLAHKHTSTQAHHITHFINSPHNDSHYPNTFIFKTFKQTNYILKFSKKKSNEKNSATFNFQLSNQTQSSSKLLKAPHSSSKHFKAL